MTLTKIVKNEFVGQENLLFVDKSEFTESDSQGHNNQVMILSNAGT